MRRLFLLSLCLMLVACGGDQPVTEEPTEEVIPTRIYLRADGTPATGFNTPVVVEPMNPIAAPGDSPDLPSDPYPASERQTSTSPTPTVAPARLQPTSAADEDDDYPAPPTATEPHRAPTATVDEDDDSPAPPTATEPRRAPTATVDEDDDSPSPTPTTGSRREPTATADEDDENPTPAPTTRSGRTSAPSNIHIPRQYPSPNP